MDRKEYKKRPLEDRFWKKVEKKSEEDCWIWKGARTAGGRYGHIGYEGKKTCRAHRVSWMLTYGDIPEGMFVLHKCDNTLCVNPSHLFLGTQQENLEDMANKKRSTIGERNPRSKLTWEKVTEIRKRYLDGESQATLSKEYSANCISSASCVSNIINNKQWKDDNFGNIARERDLSGEKCPSAKLTWKQVSEIRDRSAKGESNRHLSKIYGVTHGHICSIVNYIYWKTPTPGVAST